jgi:hypothetical protein
MYAGSIYEEEQKLAPVEGKLKSVLEYPRLP